MSRDDVQSSGAASEPGDDGRELDRQITQYLRLGLPVATMICAVVAGWLQGAAAVILVLAAGVLVSVIAIFWASIRTLVGETPLSGADAYALGAPRAEEEQKRAVLRALKDLEFERSVGKISDEDYEALAAKYRAEGKRLLRLLDESAQPGRAKVEALVMDRLIREGLAEREGYREPPAERKNKNKKKKGKPAAARVAPARSVTAEPVKTPADAATRVCFFRAALATTRRRRLLQEVRRASDRCWARQEGRRARGRGRRPSRRGGIMKRSLLAVAAVLALGSRVELSEAAGPPTAPASANPAASAVAPGPAPPAAAGQGALPPGHPPVAGSGDGLPPGHPPVADDDEDEPSAPARGGARGDPSVFHPLEDTAVDDPTLPPGTVVVTIKDAQEKAIPHAPITLGALHNSVAKGESNERFAHDGDAGGEARFEGLAVGTGHAYRVSTTRGPAQYTAPPFGLAERAGKRVTLHSYEVSGSIDDVRVYMKGEVDIGLREDAIVVEQPLGVLNLSPVAWAADAPIDLPAGFKAFNKEDSMDDARVEEVPGSGAAIRGTFPPGQRALHFRYQVPLAGESSQTLHIRLPRHMVQVRVIAEASRSMSLAVAGFPHADRVDGRDGKHYLLTEQVATQTLPEMATLDITLSGLPTPSPARWVAVALAVLALLSGIFYFTQGGALDDDARQDMLEAREALLTELVALERAHKDGTLGPKTYARVRAALLDALARIVTMSEPAKAAKARGQGATR